MRKSPQQTLNRRYKQGKHRAKARQLAFTLSFKNFARKVRSGCYYCNADLLKYTGLSLDRIDSRYGYTNKNTVGCCPTCNMIKGSHLTMDETKLVLDFIKQMRDNPKQLWGNSPSTKRRR